MSSKNSTTVVINGKIYTLSGYESEDYLQRVAVYINNKINELNASEVYRKQSQDVQRTLLELNIADDYFKAKKQADSNATDTQTKDQQIYDLKHELIAAQIDAEAVKKELIAANNTINEQKLQIVRLETELADKDTTKRRRSTL